MINKYMFYPSVELVKTTGKERNCCEACSIKFNKGDEVFQLVSSAYGGRVSCNKRLHKNCFLLNFMTLFNIDIEKLTKELIIFKLKNGNE